MVYTLLKKLVLEQTQTLDFLKKKSIIRNRITQFRYFDPQTKCFVCRMKWMVADLNMGTHAIPVFQIKNPFQSLDKKVEVPQSTWLTLRVSLSRKNQPLDFFWGHFQRPAPSKVFSKQIKGFLYSTENH